ncbi:MAG: hypothetical protein ACLP3C_27860 [Mycobacterium sp.]|uniref:hypothetical protein n=1 Tax=Mycobacterium sp. TaxID=1785 RepID=UPI003F983E63
MFASEGDALGELCLCSAASSTAATGYRQPRRRYGTNMTVIAYVGIATVAIVIVVLVAREVR